MLPISIHAGARNDFERTATPFHRRWRFFSARLSKQRRPTHNGFARQIFTRRFPFLAKNRLCCAVSNLSAMPQTSESIPLHAVWRRNTHRPSGRANPQMHMFDGLAHDLCRYAAKFNNIYHRYSSLLRSMVNSGFI